MNDRRNGWMDEWMREGMDTYGWIDEWFDDLNEHDHWHPSLCEEEGEWRMNKEWMDGWEKDWMDVYSRGGIAGWMRECMIWRIEWTSLAYMYHLCGKEGGWRMNKEWINGWK